MATGRSRRWQVWSYDQNSGRWMVVDEGREDAVRGRAARRMDTARKHSLTGAAYVALPPGEEPRPEHRELAVTEDETSPPDVSLSGTGTFVAEESPITMSGTVRLSVTGHAVTAEQGAENLRKTAHLSLATPDAPDRFAPEAFAHVVGHAIPMRLGPGDIRWVRVAAADVTEDGSSMTLRLEPADGPDEGEP